MIGARRIITAIALLSIPFVSFPIATSAQTPATAPADKKLSMQKLKEMRAKWSANKPKLKACRAEVRKKGLAGDDRWFFIEDCMAKP